MKHQSDLTEQDVEFLEWIDIVESIVKMKLGFKLLDISDMPYYVSFESGVTSDDMAERTIRNFNIFS